MRFPLHNILVAVLLAVLPAAAFADLKEIREKGELRHLGIRYANFVTGAGDGFDVELVQGFARHIGVGYKLVYSDFYSVVTDLLGKNVSRKGDTVELSGSHPVKGDMIATGFTILPWREKILLFSDATFPSQVLLVARATSDYKPIKGSTSIDSDIAETRRFIGGRSLLVMEKTCLDPANYDLKGKGLDLRPYTRSTNINEMVPTLLEGSVDFTLLDVPSAILDLQKWAGRIKVLGPISHTQELAAAFPKSSPQLRDAFNAYLRQIRNDGSYDALVRKYYPGIQRYFPEFFARKT
jgi:ABC-type amino acid transport substrate-binding protein